MTRLFINLFLIVMLCFTLSALPINTEILDFFDFGTLFSSEDPVEEEEIVPVDDTFVPEFTPSFSWNDTDRIYNPSQITLTLETNIPAIYEANYSFDDLTLSLMRNNELYVTYQYDRFVKDMNLSYDNDTLKVTYTMDVSYDQLNLDLDGFYTAEFSFTGSEKSDVIIKDYKIAYRPDIHYVLNGQAENNGNFIYKAFFLNEDKTHLVPLYFSVKYPESITVEARNRLYNPPTQGYGLSTNQAIPSRTSVAKIGDKHYGVFFLSSEFKDIITNHEQAQLAIDSIVQTLIRLPHIEKLTFFVDEAQVEGSLFDIDLKTVYEETPQSYAYLTEVTSTENRYLVPVAVNEENIYDEVWQILALLRSGKADDKNWTQILPPEVEVSNFIIEGTTITIDFNDALTSVYKDFPEYEKMMLNSIIYSMTSIENISKVAFTIDGEALTSFADMDLTEPVLAPPYINYIGEY